MMSNPLPSADKEIGLALAKLRGRFMKHQPYRDLREQFDRLLLRRRSAIELGIPTEARGIVVTGASGSGKTTLVDQLLNKHPDLNSWQDNPEVAEVIRLLIPTPATLKHVGSTTLTALGYPLVRDKPAAFIWDQVRILLERRQTLFLHLDEAQDLYSSDGRITRDAVVNTLKSLMNNKDWPVSLILSGMPRTIEMINSDDQLKRRFYVVELKPTSWLSHTKDITAQFRIYLDASGLQADPDIQTDDFLPRLAHAGTSEFGLIIETMLSGIEEAYYARSETLALQHFTEAFRRKSGCPPSLNPFIADDFMSIDTRAILSKMTFGGDHGF